MTTTNFWTNRDRTIFILNEDYSLATALADNVVNLELYGSRAPGLLDSPEEEPEIDPEFHMYLVHSLLAEMLPDFNEARLHTLQADLLWKKAKQYGGLHVDWQLVTLAEAVNRRAVPLP